MTTYRATSPHAAPSPLANGFKAFAEEAFVVLDALFSPRRIITEVEQMRALQNEASRIQPTDPARAAALRRQASLIGLR